MKNESHDEDVLGKAYDARLARRLWTYARAERRRLSLAVGLLILGAGAELAGPLLTKIAVDRYIMTKDWNGLTTIVAAFIAVALAAALLRWGEAYLTGAAGQFIVYRLRMQTYEKLQRLSIPYYDQNPVGRLMSRLTSDVQALYELFSSGMVAIVGDIVTLLGIMAVMFVVNWRLALITLSVVPPLILITFVFRKRVRDLYRQTRLKIANLNSYLHENVVGMRVVQLFNREEENFRRFNEVGADLRQTYLKTIFYYAVFYPAVEFVSALAVALIIFGGGRLMIAQVVTLGTLVAFVQYVERFYRPVRDLAEKYNIFQGAMAAAERLFALLDHPVEVMPPEVGRIGYADGAADSTVSLSPPFGKKDHGATVEFRQVWFAYRKEEWVLQDVSFRVDASESVAIVGATGAGKTTIISLICRFYDVTRGQILVNGIDVREWDLTALRQLMGLVLQDVFIFAGSIRDNIRYGQPQAVDGDVQAAARLVHADAFINRLPERFDGAVTERGATLSTGERQLLSFARALLCKPRLLILDEATASVDTETERLVQDAIATLLTGRTSIIVAHRLSTIQRCDRILVVHHGRLCEQGTAEELLARPSLFNRLYQLQYRSTTGSGRALGAT